MITPSQFTASIRETFGEYPVHSKGCRKFAKIMQGLFGGDLYYNGEHFLAFIDGFFYDLRGKYSPTDEVVSIYEGRVIKHPISDFIHEDLFGKDHIKASFNE